MSSCSQPCGPPPNFPTGTCSCPCSLKNSEITKLYTPQLVQCVDLLRPKIKNNYKTHQKPKTYLTSIYIYFSSQTFSNKK